MSCRNKVTAKISVLLLSTDIGADIRHGYEMVVMLVRMVMASGNCQIPFCYRQTLCRLYKAVFSSSTAVLQWERRCNYQSSRKDT